MHGHDIEKMGRLAKPREELASIKMTEDVNKTVNGIIAKIRIGPEFYKKWGLENSLGPPRVLAMFRGPKGAGKQSLAGAIAKELDMKVLTISREDLENCSNCHQALSETLKTASSENAIVVIDQAESIFKKVSDLEENRDKGLSQALISAINKHDGVPVILVFHKSVLLDPALETLLTHSITVDVPTPEEREKTWTSVIPPGLPLDEDISLATLSREYALNTSQIKSSLRMVVDEVIAKVNEGTPSALLTMDDMRRACSKQIEFSAAFEELGELREPGFGLDRVVLPDATLAEVGNVILHAKSRNRLFNEFGLNKTIPLGKGITILLAGPPGTGKTLTAEAIASEFGKNLFIVTADSILDKWYGESEANASRIFSRAAERNAVLLFDEADSVFTARSGLEHYCSRTDDKLLTVLLSQIERIQDVPVILTTNRPQDLDPALRRRIAHKIEIPPPRADQRLSIWRVHIPEEFPLADDVDMNMISCDYVMTGGQIKNAVIAAGINAIRRCGSDKAAVLVTTEDIEAACRQELGGTDICTKPDRIPVGFQRA